MHRRSLAAAFGAALLLPLSARAHDYTLGDLRIAHPWTRATAAPGAAGAGFMTIRNTGTVADTLLRAESTAAGAVELHTMTMDQGVMRMRPVPEIAIPPGAEVKLAPGGLHVMLLGTKQKFEPNQRIPVTLVFARAGRIDVELEVGAAGAATGGHTH